jgi:hypothetical protein
MAEKPNNIEQPVWDKLPADQQTWVELHEALHARLRAGGHNSTDVIRWAELSENIINDQLK